MQYRRLGNTGLDVSVLGFGGSSLGAMFRQIDDDDALRAVHVSLDGGVNFIDTSPFYGLTLAETNLGRALRDVPRDRYYLSTKVGRYGYEPKDFDFSAARVRSSVDESLARLGVEYVDLIQVHDMEHGDLRQIIDETVPALRDVVGAGKARFVGVTGLPLAAIDRVVRAVQVDAVISFCHYELNDTSLESIVPTLASRGVGIINAAALGMGLLTGVGPPDWHPAPQALKDRCREAADLCERRGTPIAKLAIQFAIAEPRIATNLVGTASSAEALRNIEWANEPIDAELLVDVLAVLEPVHNLTWPSGRPENNGPTPGAISEASS